ncbi:MAG TPA: CPBP family intramembrane glutamic endopeptidase [Anaerolineales bacterium]|nr:CPBP family intramembrane glutamic endopeptidase [Anaerolineales bacterium]
MTISNQPIDLDVPRAGNSSRRAVTSILIGCAIMFGILHYGVTWLAGLLDQTWAALITTIVMLVVALGLEKLFFNRNPVPGLSVLGFGRPDPRALLVAAIIAMIMLAFFPIFSLITDAQITLKSGWLWILLAIVTFNGIGEETLFRGFVFGGLRREAGLSFRQAGFISMIIFAAVHLLLFLGNPFFVGFLGTLIAIASAFPMAYLFERGNNTIWAPVVLHVATHAIRLVDISEPQYLTAVGIWLTMQIGMMFLVYAFLGNLLKPQK